MKITGYGVADRKSGAAASPDTVYKIGSISKQFHRHRIMLWPRGAASFRIDDPVSR